MKFLLHRLRVAIERINPKINKMAKKKEIKQGDVWMVDLSIDSIDHEQSGIRPCIVLQQNHLNDTSGNVMIAPITSQLKKEQPFHYFLYKENYPFFSKSKNIVLTECMTCVSKGRLERLLGKVFYKDITGIIENMKYVFIKKED